MYTGDFEAVTNNVYWRLCRCRHKLCILGDFGGVTNGVYWETLGLSQMVYIGKL